jgi:hypothetical protein
VKGIPEWLRPGNDRELARTRYAGRESASDEAARKRRESHRRSGAQKAAKAGQEWTDRRSNWFC